MPGSYCVQSDVESYLGMATGSGGALMAALIPRISRFFDQATNMPLGWDSETVTEYLTGVVDRKGNLSVLVGKPVVNSVSAISVLYSPYAAALTVDLTTVWLDGPRIRVMDGKLLWLRDWRLRVQVTYVGGYSPLPDDIVHAAIVLTARTFKAKDAGFSDVVGSDALGTLIYSKIMPREIQALVNTRRRVAVV